jgi:hypothetical protein
MEEGAMGGIGEERREVEFEPLPDEPLTADPPADPAVEPAPAPVEEPVPA